MATTTQRLVLSDPRTPLTIVAEGAQIRVQLCLSPHCSTVASLLEAASTAWWTGDPDGWEHAFKDRSGGVDVAALAPYTAYPAVPRFLTSSLDDPAPAFAAQLEEIRATPDDRARREVLETFGDNVPRAYLPFLREPARAIDALCTALHGYWTQVIEPFWPRMRVTLEREILRQAYAFTSRPAEVALHGVHPAMTFDGDVLMVQSVAQQERTELGTRVLMLTPLICASDGLIADVFDDDRVKIGYAAPGAQEVWDTAGRLPEPAEQLTALLGKSRARILAALSRPATTSALSTRLDLSLATVSEHLGALHGLGLADRTRVGRSVEYGLTPVGADLLELFEARP